MLLARSWSVVHDPPRQGCARSRRSTVKSRPRSPKFCWSCSGPTRSAGGSCGSPLTWFDTARDPRPDIPSQKVVFQPAPWCHRVPERERGSRDVLLIENFAGVGVPLLAATLEVDEQVERLTTQTTSDEVCLEHRSARAELPSRRDRVGRSRKRSCLLSPTTFSVQPAADRERTRSRTAPACRVPYRPGGSAVPAPTRARCRPPPLRTSPAAQPAAGGLEGLGIDLVTLAEFEQLTHGLSECAGLRLDLDPLQAQRAVLRARRGRESQEHEEEGEDPPGMSKVVVHAWVPIQKRARDPSRRKVCNSFTHNELGSTPQDGRPNCGVLDRHSVPNSSLQGLPTPAAAPSAQSAAEPAWRRRTSASARSTSSPSRDSSIPSVSIAAPILTCTLAGLPNKPDRLTR